MRRCKSKSHRKGVLHRSAHAWHYCIKRYMYYCTVLLLGRHWQLSFKLRRRPFFIDGCVLASYSRPSFYQPDVQDLWHASCYMTPGKPLNKFDRHFKTSNSFWRKGDAITAAHRMLRVPSNKHVENWCCDLKTPLTAAIIDICGDLRQSCTRPIYRTKSAGLDSLASVDMSVRDSRKSVLARDCHALAKLRCDHTTTGDW